MALPSMLALFIAFWSSCFIAAAKAGVKRTVDDTEGDAMTKKLPLYLPPNLWSRGHQCSGCHAKPDKNKTRGETWHDTTQDNIKSDVATSFSIPRNVTIEFCGTAVTVFAILDNQRKRNYDTTATHLKFIINGASVGNYDHTPTSDTPEYLYDIPVYTNATLSNDNHTITIALVANNESSLFLFDYLEYTYKASRSFTPPTSLLVSSTQDSSISTSAPSFTSSIVPASASSPTSAPSSAPSIPSITLKSVKEAPIGTIVGSVVGGLALIGTLLLAFLLLKLQRTQGRRRTASSVMKHKDEHDKGGHPTMFALPTTGSVAAVRPVDPRGSPTPSPHSSGGTHEPKKGGDASTASDSSAAWQLLETASSPQSSTSSHHSSSVLVLSATVRRPSSEMACAPHRRVADQHPPHIGAATPATIDRSHFAIAHLSEGKRPSRASSNQGVGPQAGPDQ